MRNVKTREEEQAVSYLLGELPEAEQTWFEQRSFQDVEFSEMLSAVENDLIDDYVRGELSASDRERVERHFLASPRRLKRVEFARAFLQVEGVAVASAASELANTPPPPPWWKVLLVSWHTPRPALLYSIVGAALLLVVAGLWVSLDVRLLHGEVARLQAERDTNDRRNAQLEQQGIDQRERYEVLSAQKGELEQKLAELKQQQANIPDSRPTLLSFILTPGYRGSEGPKRLIIPRGIRVVRLQLNLNSGDEYSRYQVQLQSASGDQVRSWNRLRAASAAGERSVFVDFPASLLHAGQYELTLRGVAGSDHIEDLGYYYFSLPRSNE